MQKEKLEQIKRMAYLEHKIYEIISKYPESKGFGKAKKLTFYSKNIELLEGDQLTVEDWEYFNIACIIPFEEILVELSKYDISSPKMDEIKFIEDLMKKYDVSKNIICARIRQVRNINKFLLDNNVILKRVHETPNITQEIIDGLSKLQLLKVDSKQRFTVLAVPGKRPFVVAPDKVEAFKNSTNSKEDNDFVRGLAETFRKNNLVEDEPKVKKIGQKTDKK